jgi:hypothetical protein
MTVRNGSKFGPAVPAGHQACRMSSFPGAMRTGSIWRTIVAAFAAEMEPDGSWQRWVAKRQKSRSPIQNRGVAEIQLHSISRLYLFELPS